MYSIRVNNRAPQVLRVCRPAASSATRNASLFPRFVQSEFSPVFKLLDAYSQGNTFSQPTRSYQPRFDVKEHKDGYELLGELPGIDQKDISIEFTDANTLSIKGRTERHREEGSKPAAKAEGNETSQVEATEEAKTAESDIGSYHKASVEEEFETIEKSEATPEETPVERSLEPSAVAAESQEAAQPSKPESSRYWVSERSVGSFSRTFTFPAGRVDRENVKASLKNGILNILLPKTPVPESKRINIE